MQRREARGAGRKGGSRRWDSGRRPVLAAACWTEAALARPAPPLPPTLRGTASVSLDPF